MHQPEHHRRTDGGGCMRWFRGGAIALLASLAVALPAQAVTPPATWNPSQGVLTACYDNTGALTSCAGGGGGSGNPSAPVSTSSLATSKVITASANKALVSFEVNADVTLAGAAWWVLVLNATSDPGIGAVGQVRCYGVPSGTSRVGGTFGSTGLTFSTASPLSSRPPAAS